MARWRLKEEPFKEAVVIGGKKIACGAIILREEFYMQEQQPEVVVIGDAMMDYQYWVKEMPKAGEDVPLLRSCMNSGGSGANSAIALAYLQVKSCFCGRIGQDKIGKEIVRGIEETGVDCSCVQYGEKTGYTLTIIDAQGERTMFSFRGCNEEPLEETPGLLSTIKNAKILLLSGYLLLNSQQAAFAIHMAGFAREHGVFVALDTAPTIDLVPFPVVDEILNLTDLLFPNERELQIVSGKSSSAEGLAIISKKVPCVALKQGSAGSTVMIRKGFRPIVGNDFGQAEQFSVKATPVQAVDTTGAGDSFNAGFIASFLKDRHPRQGLSAGNGLARKVVLQQGAISLFTQGHQADI
ncbi:MAG: carbohydrate kinase family protein [Sphaerochaetaceae bacterium]